MPKTSRDVTGDLGEYQAGRERTPDGLPLLSTNSQELTRNLVPLTLPLR
jgi:hypothetical protein